MTLFLQFHICALSAGGTKLLSYEVLPSHTFGILLMQTHGANSTFAVGTRNCENGALSSWHLS